MGRPSSSRATRSWCSSRARNGTWSSSLAGACAAAVPPAEEPSGEPPGVLLLVPPVIRHLRSPAHELHSLGARTAAAARQSRIPARRTAGSRRMFGAPAAGGRVAWHAHRTAQRRTVRRTRRRSAAAAAPRVLRHRPVLLHPVKEAPVSLLLESLKNPHRGFDAVVIGGTSRSSELVSRHGCVRGGFRRGGRVCVCPGGLSGPGRRPVGGGYVRGDAWPWVRCGCGRCGAPRTPVGHRGDGAGCRSVCGRGVHGGVPAPSVP